MKVKNKYSLNKSSKKNTEENKLRRKIKWEKDRERWKNDETYQKRQKERLDRLKSKGGYEKNINRGKEERQKIKEEKVRIKKLNERRIINKPSKKIRQSK